MSEQQPGTEPQQDHQDAESTASDEQGTAAGADEPTTSATEFERADLQNVAAETVMLKQSGAEQITAEQVVMEQSGAKSIETTSAKLDQSGVVALGSDHAELTQSSAIQIVAEEAELSKSSAFYVSARQARIEDSRIVLFTGTADGEIKTLFTPVTAAALGAAFGLIFALAGLVIRSLAERE